MSGSFPLGKDLHQDATINLNYHQIKDACKLVRNKERKVVQGDVGDIDYSSESQKVSNLAKKYSLLKAKILKFVYG